MRRQRCSGPVTRRAAAHRARSAVPVTGAAAAVKPLVPLHGPPNLSGAAVARYGIDRVDAAYRLAVNVTTKAISDPWTLAAWHPTRDLLCPLLPYLTADGRQRLDDVLAGRGERHDVKVRELVRYGVDVSGYALRPPFTRGLVVAAPPWLPYVYAPPPRSSGSNRGSAARSSHSRSHWDCSPTTRPRSRSSTAFKQS